MTPPNELVALLVVLAIVATMIVRFIRAEQRRDVAYAEHLRQISRRCPACQPWGGWYLGAMREDGSYETITCDVCGGTGELPDA